MDCCYYTISFLIYIFCSSINASNDWSTFEVRDIYPIADKRNCVCPFIYQNNVYNDCTIDGDNGNIPWCSLTTEYQSLFTYCYNFWNSTLKCLPSFKVNGKTYTKCDYVTSTANFGPGDRAIPISINDTEKQEILVKFNQFCANFSRYMFKLYWNDELAKHAQANSNMCVSD
ncbi:unnamed protein product [Rotaria sp. Silwood1]|nr:unnamed protein product [Rotaria sp. Silwood1]CAF3748885.1 unnamed protein product [Rotaria sp. Silwood1]